MDVTGFLRKALPWIGAAATGNIPALVNLAAQEVGKVTGKEITSDPNDIAAAVAGATPDQILQLKKLDQDFQVKMQELGFQHIQELEEIAEKDRESARLREMTVKDRVPLYLAMIVVIGFLLTIIYMLTNSLPPGEKDAVMLLLGALAGGFASVLGYYFGSSAGSASKDATINRVIK